MDWREKINNLGWTLPPPPSALASYIPAKKWGNAIYTSGQLPLVEGNLPLTGKLGKDVSIQDAQNLAHIAVLNAISAASTAIQSNEDLISIIRLGVYVACVPEFEEQHLVANGASLSLEKIWGDKGKHARFAVGVTSLPLDSPLELDLILEVGSK